MNTKPQKAKFSTFQRPRWAYLWEAVGTKLATLSKIIEVGEERVLDCFFGCCSGQKDQRSCRKPVARCCNCWLTYRFLRSVILTTVTIKNAVLWDLCQTIRRHILQDSTKVIIKCDCGLRVAEWRSFWPTYRSDSWCRHFAVLCKFSVSVH